MRPHRLLEPNDSVPKFFILEKDEGMVPVRLLSITSNSVRVRPWFSPMVVGSDPDSLFREASITPSDTEAKGGNGPLRSFSATSKVCRLGKAVTSGGMVPYKRFSRITRVRRDLSCPHSAGIVAYRSAD